MKKIFVIPLILFAIVIFSCSDKNKPIEINYTIDYDGENISFFQSQYDSIEVKLITLTDTSGKEYIITAGYGKEDIYMLKNEQLKININNENLEYLFPRNIIDSCYFYYIIHTKNGLEANTYKDAITLFGDPTFFTNKVETFIKDREFKQAKNYIEFLNSNFENMTDKVNELYDEIAINKKEREQLITKTKKSLRSKHDDFNGITWYYDKSTSKWGNRNRFYLYIGEQADVWMNFAISYCGDDWLFIKKYIIKADNERFELMPDEVKRDNNSGDVWEWSVFGNSSNIRNIVRKVIESKTAKLRCVGRKYHKDRTITKKEKKALKNILSAYYTFGGK